MFPVDNGFTLPSGFHRLEDILSLRRNGASLFVQQISEFGPGPHKMTRCDWADARLMGTGTVWGDPAPCYVDDFLKGDLVVIRAHVGMVYYVH